jgi:hypothetical protein
MSENNDLPILMLIVRCFDRRRGNPFPLENRWHYLDCAKLPAQESAEILQIVGARSTAVREPIGLGETVMTFSIGKTPTAVALDRVNDQILKKYRARFVPIPGNDAGEFFKAPERCCRPMQTVGFAAEYTEYEDGTPVSSYEMWTCPHSVGAPREVVSGCLERFGADIA